MLKTVLFLTALALTQAAKLSRNDQQTDTEEDSCEYLENGCPADYNIHLLLPHETSCRLFYNCANGEKILLKCNRGSVFNPAKQICDHPGSIDRTCEDEDSSSEEESVEKDQSKEEIELLPNGCPVDWSISQYLPHDYYCNKYYQCNFGELVERRCAPGTHFNPATQNCGYISDVNCTLPGGDVASSEEVDTPEDTISGVTPPADLLDNGCPADGSVDWLVPHEDDCNKFYFCVWGGKIPSHCPTGLHFSIALQRCESPAVAGCMCKDKGCSETCTGDDCDNDVSGCTGDNCDNDAPGCTGDDCDNDASTCTGNNCDNDDVTGCTGDNCDSEAPGCTGDNCDNDASTCTGNDCDSDASTCTGNNCDNGDVTGCTGDNCDSEAPGCTGENCDNDASTCTGNDCDSDGSICTGDNCDNDDVTGCTGNNCDSDDVTGCTGDNCDSDASTCTGDNCDNDVSACTGDNCQDSSSEEDLPVSNDPTEPECIEEITQSPENKKCEEECNVLPWAHEDCDKFWTCEGQQAVLGVCSEGLNFNPSTHTCDFACNAGCVKKGVQTTAGHEGLRVFLPWDKVDDETRHLLRLIGH